MRTNLIHTTLIYLVILLTARFAISAPVEPVRTEVVPWARTAPLMNGIAEACYSEIQTTDIFNATGYSGEADFTAWFRFCCDISYLYMYINITDDVDHSYHWGVGHTWEFDNIEIFLQLDTNTCTTSYSGTTVQLRVCRNLDSVESAGRAKRSDFGYYMKGALATGWIAEVAVPWTAVLKKGSVPEDIMDYIYGTIGFDFMANDSDNSDGDLTVGNLDVQSAWDLDDPDDADDRTEDNAWNNTSVFGYIVTACYDSPGLSLENGNTENRLQFFPNPAGEYIRIQEDVKSGPLIIYDIQGNVVMTQNHLKGQDIDISGLTSGMYTLVIDGQRSGRFLKK